MSGRYFFNKRKNVPLLVFYIKEKRITNQIYREKKNYIIKVTKRNSKKLSTIIEESKIVCSQLELNHTCMMEVL